MTKTLIFSAFFALCMQSVKAQCPAVVTPSQNPVCVNQGFTLTASTGANTYQWSLNGNSIGINSNVLSTQLNVPGTQTYQVIIDFGNCIDTVFTSISAINPPVATASNNNACVGNTLMLYTNTNCWNCNYSWNGPNGFTSTQQNPSIPNAQTLYNGVYTAMVSNGLCFGSDTTLVNIQPGIPINAGNNGPVCTGDTLLLSADSVLGTIYSWTGPGGFTSSLQDPAIIVDNTTQGGMYYVTSNNGCLVYDSTFVTVCNTILVNLYNDLNSNCALDNGDVQPFSPIQVEIDSNGVALDTLSVSAGFYCTAHGNTGDIYSFKLLSLAGGLAATCPNTGIVDHTITGNSFTTIDMGMECGGGNDFDLALYASNPTSSAVAQTGHIYVSNSYCYPTNGTVTMTHSPKYQYNWANPLPDNVTGNVLTWNVNNLSLGNNGPTPIYYSLYYSTAPLIAGDTTHSYFSITPTTGDQNPTNNTWTKIDTVVASQDPNAIMAYPEGCVTAGTKLQYTIMFENIGNAPAENIYVMDTLPGELEANTMELVMASHNMYVTKLYSGGNTIFRFDFPNINLPDSSDHAGCHGQLVYTINTNSALPYGADIDHRAGIYFDYNSVVMTNTYRTSICVPANVSTVSGNGHIMVFPNPAGDELTVQTDGTYNNCTITNSIGQVMLQQDLGKADTKLNIRSLAPGIYYVNVKGEGVQEVLKFVKM